MGIADPEAGRVDDLQIEAGDHLDAYQVKWSRAARGVSAAEFRKWIVDLVEGQDRLRADRKARGVFGRVVAHLVTNRPLSKTAMAAAGQKSLRDFMDDVWRPAQSGVAPSAAAMPEDWRAFWAGLAEECEKSPDELLRCASH